MMKLSRNKYDPPNWFWLALIPVVGGSAIVYAGYRAKRRNWLILGIGLLLVNLLYTSNQLLPFIVFWLVQVLAAFSIRRKYYRKVSQLLEYNLESQPQIIEPNSKIDINKCSKDEMVYQLGLPIVYANNIELLRYEGYIFTDLEELSEIAGIPKSYLKHLETLITFRYHPEEEDLSWRRVNSYTESELVRCGLSEGVARKIVEERTKNGSYHSVIEIRNRTGLTLHQYREII